MPLLRCQAVLKHRGGIPKDSIVNTFHVLTAESAASQAEIVAEALRDFYVGTHVGVTEPLYTYLANSVGDTGHEIRVYDIDEASGASARFPDAPPLFTEVFDFLGNTLGGNGLPNEVAVCLSYRNLASSSVPPARRRGRIYFGPLSHTGVVAAAPPAEIIRPSIPLTTDLREAALSTHSRLALGGNQWVVYSRPYAGRDEIIRPNRPPLPALPARNGVTYLIDQFWTDDAFDTMRSRGEAATGRVFTEA